MPRMKRSGAVKRSRGERVRDKARIAQLHLQRKTITEIAHDLNLSRDTVWRDLRDMEEQWKKDGMLDMHRAKMRQLQELREIRAEALIAWEKSKEKEEETTQNIPAEMDEKGNIIRTGGGDKKIRVTVKRRSRVGEARFLELWSKTIDQEAELLGTKIAKLEVDAPGATVNAGVIGGGVILLPLTTRTESDEDKGV